MEKVNVLLVKSSPLSEGLSALGVVYSLPLFELLLPVSFELKGSFRSRDVDTSITGTLLKNTAHLSGSGLIYSV